MICDDCRRGADLLAGRLAGKVETVASRLGYSPEHEAAVNHDRCQARTDAQRTALPFALSSCACQHRTPAVAPTRLDWHYGPTADDPDPGKMLPSSLATAVWIVSPDIFAELRLWCAERRACANLRHRSGVC